MEEQNTPLAALTSLVASVKALDDARVDLKRDFSIDMVEPIQHFATEIKRLRAKHEPLEKHVHEDLAALIRSGYPVPAAWHEWINHTENHAFHSQAITKLALPKTEWDGIMLLNEIDQAEAIKKLMPRKEHTEAEYGFPNLSKLVKAVKHALLVKENAPAIDYHKQDSLTIEMIFHTLKSQRQPNLPFTPKALAMRIGRANITPIKSGAKGKNNAALYSFEKVRKMLSK